METQLNVKAASIIGGRSIDTDLYKTMNQTLHLCSLPLSRLLIFLLECDSNNTTRSIVPRDSKIINQQLEAFKEEFDFSKDLMNQPVGKLETGYKILIPTQIEMKRFTNAKIERVALSVYNLLLVMMSVDSGGLKNFVEMADREDVSASYVVAKKVAEKWIGTGKKGKDGKYNTGYEIPPLVEIGRLVPKLNMTAAQFQEPSVDAPALHMPDSPDTAKK